MRLLAALDYKVFRVSCNAVPLCLDDQLCLTHRATMRAHVSKQLPAANLTPQVQGQSVSEILEIDVKPGWKQGTKITFPQKGKRCSS